jgi:uncharacterized membrane protein YhaH (DUF805 family)
LAPLTELGLLARRINDYLSSAWLTWINEFYPWFSEIWALLAAVPVQGKIPTLRLVLRFAMGTVL